MEISSNLVPSDFSSFSATLASSRFSEKQREQRNNSGNSEETAGDFAVISVFGRAEGEDFRQKRGGARCKFPARTAKTARNRNLRCRRACFETRPSGAPQHGVVLYHRVKPSDDGSMVALGYRVRFERSDARAIDHRIDQRLLQPSRITNDARNFRRQ